MAILRTQAIASSLALYAVIALSGCHIMSGHAKNETGALYYEQGNFTAARQYFQQAVLDNPENPDYIHNLASAIRKQGDMVTAERTYRHALNMRPSHQPSYHSLATLLVQQNRGTEAVDLMSAWADTQPYTAEPHVELAWLKREMGDMAGAEQSLRTALQVEPGNHIATAHLGQLYQDTGQGTRALAMYQRSLHNNWYQPEVQSRVAQMGQSPTRLVARPVNTPMGSYYGPYQFAAPAGPRRVSLQHPLPTYDYATSRVATAPIINQPAQLSQIEYMPATTATDSEWRPRVASASDLPLVQAH
ncbi:MAG: hypothetical protein CMJ78_12285 [Planctomycetaceae bacterium]|nr:hypothetical protein [Planctomycetaceae bacterium]